MSTQLPPNPQIPPPMVGTQPVPAEQPGITYLDEAPDKWVIKRCKALRKRAEAEDKERAADTINNWLMYSGKHFSFINVDTWKIDTESEDDELLRKVDWFGSVVDGIAAQWEESRPEVQISAPSKKPALKPVADLSLKVATAIRAENQDAVYRQSEAKYAMLSKGFFVRTYACFDEEAEAEQVPDIAEGETTSPIPMMCIDCAKPFEATQPEAPCPNCHSTETIPQGEGETLPAADISYTQTTKPVKIKLRLVDPLEIHAAPKGRGCDPRTSPWWNWEQSLPRYELESLFPGEKLPETAGQKDNYTLDAQKMLERARFGADERKAESKEDGELIYSQWWWERKMYAHYAFRKGGKLGKTEIPPNVPLGEVFKQGFYFSVINETLFRSEDEHKCKVTKNGAWSGAPYKLNPTKFWGKDLGSSARDIQEMLDDHISLWSTSDATTAAPDTTVDPVLADPDDLRRPPGGRVIQLKESYMDNDPNFNKHDAAMKIHAGGNFAASGQTFVEVLLNIGQRATGNYDPMNGGEAKGTDTYRGLLLQQQRGTGLLTPALALRAEMVEKETTYQILELAQLYATPDQLLAWAGEFDDSAISLFRDKEQFNIRRDLKVEIIAGSWTPKTKMERVAALTDAVEMRVNAQVPVPVSLIQAAEEEMGVPPEVDENLGIEEVANSRVQNLKQLLTDSPVQIDETGNVPPDFILQIVNSPRVKPRVLRDDHLQFVSFYKREGMKAEDDPEPQLGFDDAIEQLILAHYRCAGLQQAMTQAAVAEAAQALIPQPNPEADKTEAAASENDAKRQHELTKMDKEHQQKSELQQMGQEHQVGMQDAQLGSAEQVAAMKGQTQT